MKLLITVWCPPLFLHLSFLSFPRHSAMNDPQSTSILRNTTAFNHERVTSLTLIQIFYCSQYSYQISLRKQHRCGTLKTIWDRNQISSLVALQALRCTYMNITNSTSSLYLYHNYSHWRQVLTKSHVQVHKSNAKSYCFGIPSSRNMHKAQKEWLHWHRFFKAQA